MNDNFYRPPKSRVDDAPQPAVAPSPRTPIAMWLVQGFAVVATLIATIGMLRFGYRLFHALTVGQWAWPLAFGIAIRALVGATFFVALLQVRKRTTFGRFMGIGIITFIALGTTWALLPAWADDRASVSKMVGFGIASLLLLGPLIWWAYSFGFSRGARGYFISSHQKSLNPIDPEGARPGTST